MKYGATYRTRSQATQDVLSVLKIIPTNVELGFYDIRSIGSITREGLA